MKVCITCKTEQAESNFYSGKNQCKDCKKEAVRMRYLKSKFGMSYGDFCEMERQQNGVCAICGQFETHRRGQRLCVDHCHSSGKVRGLLCHHCNTALGLLGDNISFLQQAIVYLTGASGPEDCDRLNADPPRIREAR